MKIAVFAVSAIGGADAGAELNAFLASHRVLSVEKVMVAPASGAAYWSFAVTYLDGPATADVRQGSNTNAGDKLDYKQELAPADFACFVRLRDLRKRLAQDEGVPMYLIFTNAQLAAMVRARCTTKADLRKIDGVGEARVEKYGARFLEEIKADEKVGESAGFDRGAGEPPAGLLESGTAQA